MARRDRPQKRRLLRRAEWAVPQKQLRIAVYGVGGAAQGGDDYNYGKGQSPTAATAELKLERRGDGRQQQEAGAGGRGAG